MTVNHKVTGTAASMPAGLALGALIALGLTLGGSALSAYLISMETVAESGIGYCAMGILLLSSLASAAAASGRIKRRRLMVCGLSGAIYYAILLAMTALFFGGQYQGMGVTALMVLCGSGLALLMGMGQGRKTRSRSRKYAHR